MANPAPGGRPATATRRTKSFSTFAGNINLLSPELLRRDGLIGPLDVVTPSFPADVVDFGPVVEFKQALLARQRLGELPFRLRRFACARPLEAFRASAKPTGSMTTPCTGGAQGRGAQRALAGRSGNPNW